MEYFKAAKANGSYIHDANGKVVKANLSGLKSDVSKLPQTQPKKQVQVDTPKDAVAFSPEAHSTDKHSDDGGVAHLFAAAWG
jgi:hypothetical protein